MNNILVVGDIYSESEFKVETIPAPGEYSIADSVFTVTGSKTINTARIISKLGNSTNFFGKAGKDDLYFKVLADFKNFGIKIDHIIQNDVKTGQISITTDQADTNAASIFFGANATVSIEDIQSIKNDLNTFKLVYASTNLPLDCLYALINLCQANRTPLFLDFSNKQKEVSLKNLENVEYISPNREEAEMIFDERIRTVDDAFRILYLFRKFCKGTIILTLDIDGCAVIEKGAKDPMYFKTTPVQSVDSKGAGDIFKGVFVSEILKTQKLETSIQNAQLIATRSVSIKGVYNTLDVLDLSF
jgi:ribokinase